MLYKVTIDGVDGQSFYVCGGTAGDVLQFLDHYDHEGSGVSLELFQHPAAEAQEFDDHGDPEEVYVKLSYDHLQTARCDECEVCALAHRVLEGRGAL